MALSSKYTLAPGRIPEILAKIQDGVPPASVTVQMLKDWGFTSSNDRSLLGVLKELGFLSADGTPTPRYKEYRDKSRSRIILGQAVRDAYGDLFHIAELPTEEHRKAIEGKFKTTHSVTNLTAERMTATFYKLLEYSDLGGHLDSVAEPEASPASQPVENGGEVSAPNGDALVQTPHPKSEVSGAIGPSLHYNIQIHLPATKDPEVYAQIFRAIREHLIEP